MVHARARRICCKRNQQKGLRHAKFWTKRVNVSTPTLSFAPSTSPPPSHSSYYDYHYIIIVFFFLLRRLLLIITFYYPIFTFC